MELNYKFLDDDAIQSNVKLIGSNMSCGWYIRLNEVIPYISGLANILNIPDNEINEIIKQYGGIIKIDPLTKELYCYFYTEEEVINAIITFKLIMR